jgi:hypothetical protein
MNTWISAYDAALAGLHGLCPPGCPQRVIRSCSRCGAPIDSSATHRGAYRVNAVLEQEPPQHFRIAANEAAYLAARFPVLNQLLYVGQVQVLAPESAVCVVDWVSHGSGFGGGGDFGVQSKPRHLVNQLTGSRKRNTLKNFYRPGNWTANSMHAPQQGVLGIKVVPMTVNMLPVMNVSDIDAKSAAKRIPHQTKAVLQARAAPDFD